MSTYALVDPTGEIVTIAPTERPDGPVLGEDDEKRGYKWLSIERVPTTALARWRYRMGVGR